MIALLHITPKQIIEDYETDPESLDSVQFLCQNGKQVFLSYVGGTRDTDRTLLPNTKNGECVYVDDVHNRMVRPVTDMDCLYRVHIV